MEAYAFSLYQSLGVYLSLIVVNCIILGRAEMYASKHGVVDSAIDGAGMGIGFTLAICAMAAIRETCSAAARSAACPSLVPRKPDRHSDNGARRLFSCSAA